MIMEYMEQYVVNMQNIRSLSIGLHRKPDTFSFFACSGSLYDLLRNESFFIGGEVILQIVRDVVQGLRFLHSSRPPILHGDLKGRNILIDSRFRAKVGDFGLATKGKNDISGTIFWYVLIILFWIH